MRGHVARKGNRYYAVIYQGTDPGTGKHKYKWVAAGDRKADAERVLNELVRQQHHGEMALSSGTLANYLLEHWLPTQELRLRPTTAHSYRSTVELHVVPYIGRLRLDKMQPADLEKLYRRLLRDGWRKGKAENRSNQGLSPTSVRYVHRVLRKALGDAQRKGLVTRNVAALADPPEARSVGPKSGIKVWDAVTLRRFLMAVKDHDRNALWVLAANTGMRRGELLALQWSDVDLDAATVSVRRAVVTAGYELHLSDVKTAAGRRTINIDEDTVEVLAKHRAANSLAEGDDGTDVLVFGGADGKPVHPDLITRMFDRLVKKHKLPRIRFHDVRHTHATLLLKAGVPAKVVSERLGHATPGFTLNVYQHVLPGMQAEAAETFRRVVMGDDAGEEQGEESDQ